MNILGLYGAFEWEANNSYNLNGVGTWVHDSGATLFKDGKHVSSISEERLTRVKYEGNYPQKSIDYCLSEGGITNNDIDCVCIPSMCLGLFYDQLDSIKNKVKQTFPNATVKILSHHLSHACASIFTSDFNEGTIITADGAGGLIKDANGNFISHETNTIGYFNKSKKIINLFVNNPNINDFANFYSKWAYQIYCNKVQKNIHIHDEKHREAFSGKVMGLSAYGKSDIVHNMYRKSLDDYEEMPYVSFVDMSLDQNPDRAAYTIQKNFEYALVDYITALQVNGYLQDNVCFSGGAFLNVLGNSAIVNSGIIKNVHIPPFTNDVGLHFGAAAWASFMFDKSVEIPYNVSLLGKNYSDDEIEQALKHRDVTYTKLDFNDICDITAHWLQDNKIIAWFQNRSEFGARALGARSLLMNPRIKENKDLLNSRVKHREYWRPFAGIILEKHLSDYFEEDIKSPYMLYSLTVKEDKRSEIPAITHEDNSCRIQTVNKKYNQQVTTLIDKFYELTGTPVVLNTSFNDNGEPIVESPEDAIKAFLNMDIDHLVIGNFIVSKHKE